MQFSQIIGNSAFQQKLVKKYTSGKISHANLFVGNNGYGTLALAVAFAQFLNCENKGEKDSCGTCVSCLKHQKLIHPDLHFVFPVATTSKITSKPLSSHFLNEWREALINNPYIGLPQWLDHIGVDKKQGGISAEESNELIKKVALKPYEGTYKIFIIWMADKMNISASNKLLKVLEEPPPNTFFILIAEDTENILSTILSRVQAQKASRISELEIKNGLIELFQMDALEAEKISLLADGSFSEAKKLIGADSQDGFYFQAFSEWMRLCFKVNIPEIILWVDQISTLGREKQKHFFSFALNIIRESLIRNYKTSELSRLLGEEAEFTDKFAPFIHHANATQIIEEVNQASYHIERNANPKVVFLDLSLKVVKLLKIKSVTL